MGFSQGLSGLNSQSKNLSVIGNNIANSQTVGFKGSRTLFADVYAGAKVGLGVRTSQVQQDFSGGAIEASNRNLDVAITGEGFFRLQQGDKISYSRNGQFNVNAEGFVTNAQGATLMGFPGGSGLGATPVPMQVPSAGLPSVATSEVKLSINLDARSDVIDRATVPFDSTDSDSYSFATNVTVFDSLGNPQNVTKFYTKTADNQWEVNAAIDGTVSPEVGTLDFTNSGLLNNIAGMDGFTFPATPGADPLSVALEFEGTTQFGNDFALNTLEQNGSTSGALVGVEIDKEGNLVGSYSNEEKQVLGTIALANFRNPEGLKPDGNNAWVISQESGQEVLGAPGQGKFGGIEAGAVETSNVDLASELVKMIVAQRSYQANSQTIKTEDEVLQTAINLR